jgi:hypothetical protein
VQLEIEVKLKDFRNVDTIAAVNLADGDGICMGYHGWCEGDFGEDPVVTEQPD